MDTVEAIKRLQESLDANGNLPVLIYHTSFLKFGVEGIAPCTQRDHVLIAADHDTIPEG